ncbi:MAG: cation diffusion facilitator family transporter [Hyphomicrobiaceae bacterium]
MSAGGSTRVVIAALAGNAAIAATKMGAALFTGSSAMLSEAVHSLADTGNQGLLLLGMRRATRPADERHPFGYSMEIYFWSFIVAIVLFSLGAGVSIYEGIEKIRDPHPMSDAYINYIVLVAAMVFEAGSFYVAITEFNKLRGETPIVTAIAESKDAALYTVLLEDMTAMAGLVIALAGVIFADLGGYAVADGIASVAIGLLLGGVAVFLTWQTKGLIIGEAASGETVDGIRQLIAENPHVARINELRTMHLGPSDVLLAMSLDFRDGRKSAAVEEAIYEMERAIKTRWPEVRRVFLEVQSSDRHAALEALPSVTAPAEH